MLTDARVGAVLPAEDMERAKAFYTQKLGLKITMEQPGGVMFEAGAGTRILVYPFGKTKAEHTVAAFQVADLADAVTALRANGIVFEEYDLPGLKTVDGVADAGGMKAAWFKDSEGNIIGLGEV